jgi:hypothetical protein
VDFTLGLGNPDPDLTGAVSPAWVHMRPFEQEKQKIKKNLK